ncbi:MAG: protein phosphatase 2C domain-containing protein [Anaerolineae bacterium]|nr:protein phosphatase 2C domain-containing protein [Anaerolineae bacterium]
MICPACGAKNRQDARFCRRCGRPLGKLEQQDAKPQEQAASMPAASVRGAEAEPAEELAEELQEEAHGEEPGPGPVAGDVSREELPADVAQPLATVQEGGAEGGGEGGVPGEEPVPPATAEPLAEGEPPEEMDTAAEIALEVDHPAPAAQDAEEESEPGSMVGEEVAGTAVEPASEPEMDVELDQDDVLGAFWREEKEPIEPASPGMLVAGRYLLLEVLDVGEDEVLYLARDLQRCWQCGAEIDAGEAFCPQCGAAQEQAAHSAASETRLLEVRPPGDEAQPETLVMARVTHEGRPFLVLGRSEPEPEPVAAPPTPKGIRLIVGQRSDPGQVRELDEDSVLAIHVTPTYQAVTSPVLGLFAVADGMGGHEGGEIASKLALQVLADRTLRTIFLPELAGDLKLDEDVLAHLRKAMLAANDAVFLARQKRGNDMGTTLTTVFVRDRRLFIAHVGDCRAYRWSDAGLEQLTTDHSVVASMIAHGQVSPDEIYTHPHRSVVYRCIGDQPMVEVDGDLLPLEPGDRIVVCSDGLWEMVRSEGIADVMMQEANPQVACDLLVRLANAAGGEDNISVVIVQVEAA